MSHNGKCYVYRSYSHETSAAHHFFFASRMESGFCVDRDLIYLNPLQKTEFLDFVCLVIPGFLQHSHKKPQLHMSLKLSTRAS